MRGCPPGIHFSSTLRSQFRPPKSASALKAMKRTLPGKCRCTNDIKRHSDSNLQKVKLTCHMHHWQIMKKHVKQGERCIFQIPPPHQKAAVQWLFVQPGSAIYGASQLLHLKFCQVAKGLAECKALHALKSTQRAKFWGKMPRSSRAPGIQLLAANSVRLQKDLQSAKRCITLKSTQRAKVWGKMPRSPVRLAFSSWQQILSGCKRTCRVQSAACAEKHPAGQSLRKMPRSPVRLAFSSWQQILSGCKRTCRVQSAACAEKHPAGQSLRKNATQPCAPGIQLLAANSVRLQKDLQSAKRCIRWKAPSGPKFEEKCHAALCAWHSALGSKFCQVAKGLAECKALHTLKSTQRPKVWGKAPHNPVNLAFSSWQLFKQTILAANFRRLENAFNSNDTNWNSEFKLLLKPQEGKHT